MDFQLLKRIVDSVNQTVSSTGIAAVRVLKKNLYAVKVSNPVTKVEVKGQVTVANQKNVEQLLKDLKKVTAEFSKKTHAVSVSNWQKPQSFTSLELGLTNVVKSVEKLVPELQQVAKEAKSAKTDKVSVINQPIPELKSLLTALQSLDLKLKSLKLDPKISVGAPVIPAPIVNVAPTPVTVEKDEFDYEKLQEIFDLVLHRKDAGKYVPVRLTTGKEFYDAVTRITGGISRAVAQKEERQYDQYVIQDGDDIYTCEAVPGTLLASKGWRIKRVRKTTSGTKTLTTVRYADATVDFDKVANNYATYTY